MVEEDIAIKFWRDYFEEEDPFKKEQMLKKTFLIRSIIKDELKDVEPHIKEQAILSIFRGMLSDIEDYFYEEMI